MPKPSQAPTSSPALDGDELAYEAGAARDAAVPPSSASPSLASASESSGLRELSAIHPSPLASACARRRHGCDCMADRPADVNDSAQLLPAKHRRFLLSFLLGFLAASSGPR